MRTDIAIDKIIEIVPIIRGLRPKIQKDEEFAKFMSDYKSKEKETDNLDFAMALIMVLLKNYKNEVFDILSIICDKTVDEIKAQSIGATINSIKVLLQDEDFKSFFQNA